MPQENCPAERLLADFAHGMVPESVAEQLTSHIDTCAACGETIDAHTRCGDGLLDHLRASIEGSEDPAAQRFLTGLRQLDLGDVLRPHRLEFVAPERIRDYQIGEKLGEGGMGVVFKAVHTRMERTVAIKLLPAAHLRPARVMRFEREIKAVARLEHPNIVRATDAGEESGSPFLVMEYIDGADLSTIVKQSGPLSVADACEVIRQAAIGLQFAHDQQLVHRDVKPSNLILARQVAGSNGTDNHQSLVKILDLGLAKLLDESASSDAADLADPVSSGDAELTRDGLILGTVDYMAPEQASSVAESDARADIYSLGCTFFFLLTGRPPFAELDTSPATLQTLVRHQNETPPPLSDFRKDVPARVEALIRKMMAKRPSDRIESMARVAKSLAPFVRSADLTAWSRGPENASTRRSRNGVASPVGSASPEGARPAKSPARTGRWPAYAVALVLLLCILGTGLYQGLTTLRVKTGDGEIEVKFDGDEVAAEVVGESIRLRSVETGKTKTIKLSARPAKTPLPAGTYEIVVATDSGIEIVGHSVVTVKVGESSPIVVKYVAGEAPAPAAEPSAAHRLAALRVIKHGGSVTCRPEGGQLKEVTAAEELPEGPFRVEGIHVWNVKYNSNDAKLLRGLTSIRHIGLFYTSIDDQALKDLATLTNCEHLLVPGNQLTTAGVVELIRSMPRLTRVSFRSVPVGKEVIAELAKRELSSLVAPDTIAVSDLAPLESASRPFDLQLYGAVSDDDFMLLRRLPVGQLVVNAEKLKGTGFSELSELTSLRTFILYRGASLEPEAFTQLKDCDGLRSLTCDLCQIDGKKLKAISQVKQITHLSLVHGSLTREDLDHFKELPNLVYLNLFNFNLSPEHTDDLREMLPNCEVVAADAAP